MRTLAKIAFLLSVFSFGLLSTTATAYADTSAVAASSEHQLRVLLTPEHFDADAAIATLEASNMSSRNKIMGKAMIDSARNTPKHQLGTALEQIRVVLGLEE
jgi:hypothetical protein